jgi:hypothetical protein
MDDERIAHLLRRFAGEVLQHSRGIDGHMAPGLRKMSNIGAGGAGIGRVTSMRLDRKTVSGMWGLLMDVNGLVGHP